MTQESTPTLEPCPHTWSRLVDHQIRCSACNALLFPEDAQRASQSDPGLKEPVRPFENTMAALVEELARIICRGGGHGLCVGFCHAKRCADAIEQYSDTARAILPIIERVRREGIEELEAENARMRDALEVIEYDARQPTATRPTFNRIAGYARAARKEQTA